jgi:predicted aspartyl protease
MSRYHDYSNLYDPAAPIFPVTIYRPSRGKSKGRSVNALIDTGTDATLIPRDILESVNAEFRDKQRLRGVLGNVSVVDLYMVTIEIGKHFITGIEAVALPKGSEIIIGRDVLNQLVITLNGPGETVGIHPE